MIRHLWHYAWRWLLGLAVVGLGTFFGTLDGFNGGGWTLMAVYTYIGALAIFAWAIGGVDWRKFRPGLQSARRPSVWVEAAGESIRVLERGGGVKRRVRGEFSTDEVEQAIECKHTVESEHRAQRDREQEARTLARTLNR